MGPDGAKLMASNGERKQVDLYKEEMKKEYNVHERVILRGIYIYYITKKNE